MDYSIKTRKIKLIATDNKKEIYSYLRTMASELSTIGNKVIRLHVHNQFDIKDYSDNKQITKADAKKIVEEKLGTSIRNSGYQALSELINISSNVRTCFNSLIFKKIQNDFFNIATNKISIPSFRKDNLVIPFQFNDNPFTLDDNNNYSFNFPSTRHTKETIGELKLSLFFGKDRSNNRVIIERIISGEYSLSDSSIQVKDNEFYLLLTYKQPIIQLNLDPNKVMGIDMGINRAVSIYIEGEKHQPQQLNGMSKRFQHERMKLFKKRNALQESLKFSKGGHGRKRKIKPLENFKEVEKNFSKNINHNISAEIIKIALEYNVGTIKMEDLTGITKNKNDYFFKSWAYYQLQTNIEYKAKMNGINVVWVNPKDTSTTCSTCGYNHKDNRSDKNKTIFKCTNGNCKDFGKVKDADINAATNIARKEGKNNKGNGKEARKEKKELLSVE